MNSILKKSSLENFTVAKKEKKIVLFGHSLALKEYIDAFLDEHDHTAYIVDNDQSKWNTEFLGFNIFPPAKLHEENPDDIIVLITCRFVFEIALQLDTLGIGNYFAVYLFHDYFIPRRILLDYYPSLQKTDVFDLLLRKPMKLSVHVNNTCNLNCKMCKGAGTGSSYNAEVIELSYEKFLYILDQIDDVRNLITLDYLLFTSEGEAFMHPQAVDMIREIRKRHLNIAVITNGLLLKNDIAKELLLASAQIAISISGINEEIYKDFQGYAPNIDITKKILNSVIENIIQLVKLKAELHSKSQIIVSYIVTKENMSHFVEYWDFFRKLGVEVSTRPYIYLDGKKLDDRSRDLKYKPLNSSQGYFSLAHCFQPAQIDIYGNVTMCCYMQEAEGDVIVLGNIYENSLREILTCENTQKIINAIHVLDLDKMPPTCKNCPFITEEIPSSYSKF